MYLTSTLHLLFRYLTLHPYFLWLLPGISNVGKFEEGPSQGNLLVIEGGQMYSMTIINICRSYNIIGPLAIILRTTIRQMLQPSTQVEKDVERSLNRLQVYLNNNNLVEIIPALYYSVPLSLPRPTFYRDIPNNAAPKTSTLPTFGTSSSSWRVSPLKTLILW